MKIFEFNEKAETLEQIMSFDDFIKRGKDLYFRIGNYMYRLHRWADYYGGIASYTLADITEAGKAGKICVTYHLEGDINAIEKMFNQNFDDTFFDIATNNFEGVKVGKTSKKAIDVFNPMTIKETYKPLKEVPSKWTLKHALRAIANFQFEDLRCDGVYTDDYAWDNAVNYQMKEIKNTAYFLKKVIESKSGWRVYDCDGRINVNCHYFDTNSFKLKIA